MPIMSNWFQKYMPRLLGPILIVTGMILLDLLSIKARGGRLGSWCQKNIEKFGLGGAFLLGVIFALSFCPVSAALFFGSLIPLSIEQSSSFLLPLIYGIGTALPVFAFALVIALGANSVSRVFDKVTQFEKWSRWCTGGVFLAVGIYFT
jgi:cytochrome c biogenesis protein CcdA